MGDFVCNRVGGGHAFGTRDCAKCRPTTRRPYVIGDDAYLFTLRVERTTHEWEEELLPRDDGTIARFQEWLRDEEVAQFSGGAVGPGFFQGIFPAFEKQRILDWCDEEDLDGLLDG